MKKKPKKLVQSGEKKNIVETKMIDIKTGVKKSRKK